jgi:hypothetical protein
VQHHRDRTAAGQSTTINQIALFYMALGLAQCPDAQGRRVEQICVSD